MDALSPGSLPADRTLPPTPIVAGYAFSLRPGVNRRELVILFSPSRKFVLQKTAFSRDTLFVADLDLLYYVPNARRLAQALLATIEAGAYDKVLFVGSSKGAFAALSIARICARLRPQRVFRTLAFSPQVRLHPANPNLYYPSYRKLRSAATRRFAIGFGLRRHGDVSLFGDLPNAHATIVHAAGNESDRLEAARLKGPNVEIMTVEGSSHGSVLYFIMHGKSLREIRSRIAMTYARRIERGRDLDVLASRPSDPDQFARDVHAEAKRLPRLDDMFGIALSREPRNLPARERLAGGLRTLGRRANLLGWMIAAWPTMTARRLATRKNPADRPPPKS